MAKMQRSSEQYLNTYEGTIYRKEEECLVPSPTCMLERRPDEGTLVVLCKNQQMLLKRLLQTLKSYLKDPHFPPPRPGYVQRKIMTDIIEQLQTSIEDQKRYVLSVERDIQNFKQQKVMREILAENSHYRQLAGSLQVEKEKAEEQVNNLRKRIESPTNIEIIQTLISDKNRDGLLQVKVSHSSKFNFADKQGPSSAMDIPDVINLIKENKELKMKLRNIERSQQNTRIAFEHDEQNKSVKAAYQIGSPIIIDKSSSRINVQTSTTEAHKGTKRIVSRQKVDVVYPSQGRQNRLDESLANERKRLEENLKSCKREMENVKSSYDSLQQEMRCKQKCYNELKLTLQMQDEEIHKLQREVEEFREKIQQMENTQIHVNESQNKVSISTEFNEFQEGGPSDWKRDTDQQCRDSWNVIHYRGSFEEES